MSESMNKILKVVIIAEAALIAVCLTLTIVFSAVRANSPVTATASASKDTASASYSQSTSASESDGESAGSSAGDSAGSSVVEDLPDGVYENGEYKYTVSGANCTINK